MKELARKQLPRGPVIKWDAGDADALRRKRIEQLKTMINNEEYLSEAVSKLAKSLTSGLMK
jgi:hypothetical protein